MDESSRVINQTCFPNLKKKICSGLYNLVLRENKEQAFCFLEKFYYSENLDESDKLNAMEKMKKESVFQLNFNYNLIKLQNLEMREFVK